MSSNKEHYRWDSQANAWVKAERRPVAKPWWEIPGSDGRDKTASPAPLPAALPAQSSELCFDCGKSFAAGENHALRPACTAPARAGHPCYGHVDVVETLDFCKLGGVDLEQAKAFILARAPVAKVRSTILDEQARASDALVTVTSPRPSAAAGAGWDRVVNEINQKYGVATPARSSGG